MVSVGIEGGILTRLSPRESLFFRQDNFVIDSRVLADFLECSGARRGDYYLLVGRGRILAALPREPEAFLRTLSLYRPQKPAARLWTAWIRLLAHARVQGGFLPSWTWSGAKEPTLPAPGILLGNPAHPSRRCLFVLRQGGKWVVEKFYPGTVVPKVLEREKVLLQAALGLGDHAPAVLGLNPMGKGWALRTEFLEASNRKPAWPEALTLLQAWLLPLPFRPLADFPLAAKLPDKILSRFPAGPGIRLRPCLRHGDFAPWNLLPCRERGLIAVDWEEGHEEDAPGFDLIHYLLQEEFLVHRSPFPIAKDRILERLQNTWTAEYLAACGWHGAENILWELALALEISARKEIADWVSSVSGGC